MMPSGCGCCRMCCQWRHADGVFGGGLSHGQTAYEPASRWERGGITMKFHAIGDSSTPNTLLPATWGSLDFIRGASRPSPPFSSPSSPTPPFPQLLNCKHQITVAPPDFNRELQLSVGTAALLDLNCERQMSVGTHKPQPCARKNRMPDLNVR